MKKLLILLCLAAVGCGGSEDGDSQAAAARPAASAPVAFALKPAHRSGVTGTATLAPEGPNLKVTLKLDQRVSNTLMAHIHTGPCSDEPTFSNPRIWVNLHEVVDGLSETTENIATLEELQSEPSSINVHDPAHNQRPLVCGDIPQAG
jgi:hypothetical protein